jgi:hypothetical protein
MAIKSNVELAGFYYLTLRTSRKRQLGSDQVGNLEDFMEVF